MPRSYDHRSCKVKATRQSLINITKNFNQHGTFNMITKCLVVPEQDSMYNFTATQAGAYWCSCHSNFCYPNGCRQAFIIHDNEAHPEYNEEISLTITDWYHEMVEDIRFTSLYNPTGAEPIPDAFIDTKSQCRSPAEHHLPAKNHQHRRVCHNLAIVERDGVSTEPCKASTLYVAVAQRYAVLVTTENTTEQNDGMVIIADNVFLDTMPTTLQLNQASRLKHNALVAHLFTDPTIDVSSKNPAFDDFDLVAWDRETLLEKTGQT
ncbi:hypothetical protein E4T49_07156 [Aureobasidium sp. EXF-10728]|nr:hypothetical protein E4T49_07156 [Aureobasidium sp. EXF-10728]